MEKIILKAIDNRFVTEPAKDILATWVKMGRPEPPGGPSTEARRLVVMLEAGDDCVLEQKQVEEYNDAMIALVETTGRRYVGNDTWYVDYNFGSDAWVDYQNQATDIVLDYVSGPMWNNYCDIVSAESWGYKCPLCHAGLGKGDILEVSETVETTISAITGYLDKYEGIFSIDSANTKHDSRGPELSYKCKHCSAFLKESFVEKVVGSWK